MATIRKRHGLFQVQVRRRGFPAISRSFLTKQEADAWALQSESELINGGTPRQRSKVLFSKALEDYLALGCDRTVTGNSRARSVAKRARKDLGAYYLDNLTPKVLCDWRDTLLAEGKANQTVRHHLALVSVVFSTAIKRTHIYTGTNPVTQLVKPSVARNGRTRVLTPEEVQRITAALDKPVAAYIKLAFETGMRRGEIEKIQREHLDESKRTLLIPITKTGRPRLIPLSSDGVRWVKELLGDGDRCTVLGDFVYRMFKAQAEKHGIEDARFHDLRHSAVTQFFEKGLGHFEVAAISGHATMQMLQRYTHISASHLGEKLYGEVNN